MKSVIIYATKYGSTAETAKRLQSRLDGECTIINVMKENVPDIEQYDTVILGGSVYAGMVQKQLKNYIKSNLARLLTKNIGIYLCAGNSDKEQIKKEMEFAFPQELLSHSAINDVLGYAYLFEKMNFFEKLVIKKIKGDNVSIAEYYDDKIESFAKAFSGISRT